MRSAALGTLLLATGLLTGCAHYEYRLIQPPTSAQVIPKEGGMTVQYDPLEYKLANRGKRVALRIMNPTDTPIHINPQRSWIVDPRGAGHPIRPSMIAPHSYVDSSLPPRRQYYYGTTYPGFGFYGSPWRYYGGFDYYYYSPWTYSYEVITPYDWSWEDGQAKIHLGYGRGDQTFEQDLVIERQKK